MVIWCCDTILSPQLRRTKASCKRTRASSQLAVQKSRQSHGPLTAVAQDESQLQEDASKFAVGSAEKQAVMVFS